MTWMRLIDRRRGVVYVGKSSILEEGCHRAPHAGQAQSLPQTPHLAAPTEAAECPPNLPCRLTLIGDSLGKVKKVLRLASSKLDVSRCLTRQAPRNQSQYSWSRHGGIGDPTTLLELCPPTLIPVNKSVRPPDIVALSYGCKELVDIHQGTQHRFLSIELALHSVYLVELDNFYYTNPCSSLGSPILSPAALISAPATVPVSSCIGKWGPSCGIATNRMLKTKTNDKLELSISLNNLAPNSIHADLFASEVSIVMRQNAPLDVEKWSQVENDVKQKICDIILQIRKIVLAKANICYRSWHSRLREHYELYQTDEEQLQNSPNNVLLETWKNLVCYFRSPSLPTLGVNSLQVGMAIPPELAGTHPVPTHSAPRRVFSGAGSWEGRGGIGFK
ncbi:hypothetical protein Ahy_A09g042647 [Arachis hypogaea]|uniref:Uncharacterized protein n=1 Tax=Arachis hypogaea TaxID=3818 RepID=A0A445BGE6_ARAHY|nr:hypothetical protein Ahy_A09g042647 [Arachis hypogaea]